LHPEKTFMLSQVPDAMKAKECSFCLIKIDAFQKK